MSPNADPTIILAFDFGLRRIGVATANLRTRTASPLTTLSTGGVVPWTQLDRLIDEWQPGQLIVGMPPEPRSEIGEQITAFVNALTARYALPVSTVDETLTSSAAQAQLRDGRRSGFLRRRVGRGRIDRHAACLIAEQWMNETAHEHGTD